MVVIACSGTPSPGGGTPTPGGPAATPTAGAPTGGAPTGQLNPSQIEAKARALVPAGATETQEVQIGGFYQLYVHSNQTLAQLEAYFDQAIPAQGMTISGKFTADGVLTIAVTNPEGGIVASSNPDGGTDIVIGLGSTD